MTSKQIELLKYLAQYDSPRKSIELANSLQISIRSVKNYIREINDLYHKQIVISSRNGYQLNRHFSVSLLINHSDNQLPQTSEERAFYIIHQLIAEHMARLDLFNLCEYLCISYSTVKSIIAMMNKMFASYHVKFVCEDDCVTVIGKEKDKRKLISYVINEESRTSFIDTEQLQKCFPKIDVLLLKSIIIRTLKKYSYYMNDFAAANMLLHILIIIERERSGNILNSDFPGFEAENQQEHQLVLDLCRQLEENFQIQLNLSECTGIYTLFRSNVNYSLPVAHEELLNIIEPEIMALTNFYVESINNLYMIDLSSQSFTTAFSLHLKNLIFRAMQGTYTNNPLKDSIRLNNPLIFDISIYIGLDLTERFHVNINEDEMAFLAMHIGAEIERQNSNRSKIPTVLLCPDYRDTCKNLMNQLMLNFGPQINLVQNVHSENDLSEISSIGLLITTIPLRCHYNFTTVQISPFNLASQNDIIQEAILTEQDQYQNNVLKKNFHLFFEEDLFVVCSKTNRKEQIISYLCDLLYQKNYVDFGFEERVCKRENAASTAFGSIAIPHSIDMDAIKTCVSVAVSKQGILWNGNTVHLVLLLAINRTDRKTFQNLYASLISLFQDDNILQKARSCTSFKEFQSLIYTYVNIQ